MDSAVFRLGVYLVLPSSVEEMFVGVGRGLELIWG